MSQHVNGAIRLHYSQRSSIFHHLSPGGMLHQARTVSPQMSYGLKAASGVAKKAAAESQNHIQQ